MADRRIKIFLGGAVAVLLGIIAVPSKKGGGSPGASFAPAILVGSVAGEESDASLLLEQLREQGEHAARLDWGDDPFEHDARLSPSGTASQPVAAPKPVRQSPFALPQLFGVSILSGDRLAVIDSEIVREGDQLATGYTVVTIDKSSVVLLRDHETLTLELGDE